MKIQCNAPPKKKSCLYPLSILPLLPFSPEATLLSCFASRPCLKVTFVKITKDLLVIKSNAHLTCPLNSIWHSWPFFPFWIIFFTWQPQQHSLSFPSTLSILSALFFNLVYWFWLIFQNFESALGLRSLGSHRVRHDWSNLAAAAGLRSLF